MSPSAKEVNEMLTKRQEAILLAVIETYNTYNEPVGSTAIKRLLPMAVSTATIRNEMVRLEEADLLIKTHISSGRVPTELGYRYFINYILPKQAGLIDLGLNDTQKAKINAIFQNPYLQIGDMLTKATEMMAELTHFVAITLGPKLSKQKLLAFRLIPIGDQDVMLILVTNTGIVENQIFHLPEPIDQGMLSEITELVNENLLGQNLDKVLEQLSTHIIPYVNTNLIYFLEDEAIFDIMMEKMNQKRLFIKGRRNLYRYLMQSGRLDQYDGIYQLLSDISQLSLLLDQKGEGIDIRIGEELADERLRSMSIVSSSLQTEDDDSNLVLAILGPESMAYLDVARLFQGIRQAVNAQLGRIREKEDS